MPWVTAGARCLEASRRIGARLSRDALWCGSRCNWLGASMEFVSGSWQVVSKTFGPELYSGTAGIALFLARLHAATRDPVFRDTARGAIAHSVSRLADIPVSSGHSLMLGKLGVVLALLELA